VKVAAVGVGLPTHLSTAHAAGVIVLAAGRQDEKELLPHGRRLPAAGAEQACRLQLTKAVYHVLILDHGGVGSAWSASSSQMGGVILGERLMDAWRGLSPLREGTRR